MDSSDIDALSAWRRTCTVFETRVHRILKRTIHAVIEHYLLAAPYVLDLLLRWNAIIIEEAALAFILRDVNVLTSTLVICMHPNNFEGLRDELLSRYTLQEVNEFPNSFEPPPGQLFRITHDRYVRLQPMKMAKTFPPINTPVATLSWAEHTAVMNFVGAQMYGSAYPSLTLRRRALLAMPRDRYQPTSATHAQLLALSERGGFTISHDPYTLLDVPFTPVRVAHFRLPCLRTMYICDCRPRYFGDGGSLVDFFELAGPSSFELLHEASEGDRGGTVPAWRFPGSSMLCPHYGAVHFGHGVGAWPLLRPRVTLRTNGVYQDFHRL